jgi:DNA-binding HxlR family transcriptional regulator
MAPEEIEGMQAAVSVLASKWSVAILAELFAALAPLAGWALERRRAA